LFLSSLFISASNAGQKESQKNKTHDNYKTISLGLRKVKIVVYVRFHISENKYLGNPLSYIFSCYYFGLVYIQPF